MEWPWRRRATGSRAAGHPPPADTTARIRRGMAILDGYMKGPRLPGCRDGR
ncbi:hypothetical protein AvCA_05230 [Azotobacter vinelandii CA]|uniref:Uncharacterized protein n=2 Tax=Azotobacter vinelandii TaxID=354 RepID=C1DJJ1_AZOVD|nr:hypothetical protein Avin_05230 [Azotobacter vinelandii DJ]AGK17267.1 hypothetical protein AvCA_05230 [Azotobacter vinelandii CA]AGK19358.1 hypothetical protein AvCA6_05230 [Azotobacter vinelandii CA6]